MPPRSIRARYANGVLTPLEPLDLTEGCEVTVDVLVDPDGGESSIPAAAGNPGILEIVDEIQREFSDAFTAMPHDGGKHYKHYLYGHARDGD